MIKKSLAVAVILLFIGIAFAIPINANVSKSSLNPVSDIEVLEKDNATPIALVFQLIAKLRNHKEIKELEANIDSVDNVQDEILRIIEGDEELNRIVEQLSGEDCGCEDATTEWDFPVLCLLLTPLALIAVFLIINNIGDFILQIISFIGLTLNCFWS